MLAVNVPLMPSPSGLMSAFSPYTDSPSSPAPYHTTPLRLVSLHQIVPLHSNTGRHSDPSGHLLPPSQRSPLASSPSDLSNPSPIAPSSNGTDTTDIDDSTIELEESEELAQSPQATEADQPEEDLKVGLSLGYTGPQTANSCPLKLETVNASGLRPGSAEDDQPRSVIHAPKSFELFVSYPTYLFNQGNILIGPTAYATVSALDPPYHPQPIPKIRYYYYFPKP